MTSRRLVIDASIARAAGATMAADPKSRQSRAFLLAVKEFQHSIVLGESLADEWKKHQSNFARRWLLGMHAAKKVEKISSTDKNNLRGRIADAILDPALKSAADKDFHLIEAAVCTDKRIASFDERARNIFSSAGSAVREIKSIMWVNPVEPSERALEWLESGAPRESNRCL